MAKTESTFINMVLTLFLVTLGAAAALGFVYENTKDAIKAAEDNKLNLAIKRVVPEFNNEPNKEKVAFASDIPGDSVFFYIARKDDVVVGYAVETFTKNGFSGLFKLMAGFTPDGKINKVAVLEHKETPGLGSKMAEPKFADQFVGQNPGAINMTVSKDGGDIDAITASTITSRAYCDAIQRAYNTLIQEYLEKGGKQ